MVGSFGSLAMGCSLVDFVALDISLAVVGRTCLRKQMEYGGRVNDRDWKLFGGRKNCLRWNLVRSVRPQSAVEARRIW